MSTTQKLILGVLGILAVDAARVKRKTMSRTVNQVDAEQHDPKTSLMQDSWSEQDLKDPWSEQQCTSKRVAEKYTPMVSGKIGSCHWNTMQPGDKKSIMINSPVLKGLLPSNVDEDTPATCYMLKDCDRNNGFLWLLHGGEKVVDTVIEHLVGQTHGPFSSVANAIVGKISNFIGQAVGGALGDKSIGMDLVTSFFTHGADGTAAFCNNVTKAEQTAESISRLLTSSDPSAIKSTKVDESHETLARDIFKTMVLQMLLVGCPGGPSKASTEQKAELTKLLEELQQLARGGSDSYVVDRTFDLLNTFDSYPMADGSHKMATAGQVDALSKTLHLFKAFLSIAGDDAALPQDLEVQPEVQGLMDMVMGKKNLFEKPPETAAEVWPKESASPDFKTSGCKCGAIEANMAANFLNQLSWTGFNISDKELWLFEPTQAEGNDFSLNEPYSTSDSDSDESSWYWNYIDRDLPKTANGQKVTEFLLGDKMSHNLHSLQQTEIATKDPIANVLMLFDQVLKSTEVEQSMDTEFTGLPNLFSIGKDVGGILMQMLRHGGHSSSPATHSTGESASSATVKQIMVFMPVLQNFMYAMHHRYGVEQNVNKPEIFAAKMNWVLALNIAWATYHQFEILSDTTHFLEKHWGEEFGKNAKVLKQSCSLGFLTTALSTMQDMKYSGVEADPQPYILKFINTEEFNHWNIAVYTAWNYGFIKFYNVVATEGDIKSGGKGIKQTQWVSNMFINALSGPILQSLVNFGTPDYWVNYRRDGLMIAIVDNRNDYSLRKRPTKYGYKWRERNDIRGLLDRVASESWKEWFWSKLR